MAELKKEHGATPDGDRMMSVDPRWCPVEDLPPQGEVVIIFVPRTRRVFEAHCYPDGQWHDPADEHGWYGEGATMFQLKPEPPC